MKGEETRQKILSAAIELISECGYAQMSMRALAKKAGMRPSNTYHYFNGKEDILNSVIDFIADAFHVYHASEAEIIKQLREQSPAHVLQQYFCQNRSSDEKLRLKLYRVLYMEQYRNNQKLRTFTQRFFFIEPQQSAYNLLDTLARLKAIPPISASVLSNICHRTAFFYCFKATLFSNDHTDQDFLEMMEFFSQCILRGVKPLEGNYGSFTRAAWGAPLADPMDKQIGTAERIIFAASYLVEQHGGDHVSVRDLCDAVGIQPGSFYNHFSSKDQVFEVLNQRIFARLQGHDFKKEPIKHALCTHNIPALVKALSHCNAPLQDKRCMVYNRILLREQYRNEELRKFYWETAHLYIDTIAQALDEAMQEGAIPQGESHKIATAYIYTMATIHIGGTMFEEEFQMVESLRSQIGNWFLGLIFNGFQT